MSSFLMLDERRGESLKNTCEVYIIFVCYLENFQGYQFQNQSQRFIKLMNNYKIL